MKKQRKTAWIVALVMGMVIGVNPTVEGQKQKVVFMPQWTPQAQFAGYYVAKAKGYYAEEGIDVEIRHIAATSERSAMDLLRSGEIDIAGGMFAQAVKMRSEGTAIVNVMQLSQRCALVCAANRKVKGFEDLKGMKVASFVSDFNVPAQICDREEGLHLEWIPTFNGNRLFVYGAVEAVLGYSYNEIVRLKYSMPNLTDEQIIRFDTLQYDIPEDGLYVMEAYAKAHPKEVEKFVRASQRGWDYARAHEEEALAITWKEMKKHHIAIIEALQRSMLKEVLRLQINPASKKADYQSIGKKRYETICEMLVGVGHIATIPAYSDFIKQSGAEKKK